MAKSETKKRIERTTGVSSNANGARGVYLVAGKRSSIDGPRWGNRRQKYGDIRKALGLSVG